MIVGDGFQDNLSEWLRRQTRNLLGFARAGSNPAVVVFASFFLIIIGGDNRAIVMILLLLDDFEDG